MADRQQDTDTIPASLESTDGVDTGNDPVQSQTSEQVDGSDFSFSSQGELIEQFHEEEMLIAGPTAIAGDGWSFIWHAGSMNAMKKQTDRLTGEMEDSQSHGIGDAYRHVLGSAFLISHMYQQSGDLEKSVSDARGVMNRHEWATQNRNEVEMDKSNNEIGYELARNLIEEGVISAESPLGDEELGDLILQEIKDRGLEEQMTVKSPHEHWSM